MRRHRFPQTPHLSFALAAFSLLLVPNFAIGSAHGQQSAGPDAASHGDKSKMEFALRGQRDARAI
jgi:hypothetical protein